MAYSKYIAALVLGARAIGADAAVVSYEVTGYFSHISHSGADFYQLNGASFVWTVTVNDDDLVGQHTGGEGSIRNSYFSGFQTIMIDRTSLPALSSTVTPISEFDGTPTVLRVQDYDTASGALDRLGLQQGWVDALPGFRMANISWFFANNFWDGYDHLLPGPVSIPASILTFDSGQAIQETGSVGSYLLTGMQFSASVVPIPAAA